MTAKKVLAVFLTTNGDYLVCFVAADGDVDKFVTGYTWDDPSDIKSWCQGDYCLSAGDAMLDFYKRLEKEIKYYE